MTYTELLLDLLYNALVAISPMKPLQPPYPKNFDVNATCDYHGEPLVTLLRNVCVSNIKWKL